MSKFNIIVAATADQGGIGHNGTLPWRLPNDMKNFKEITLRTESQGKQNAVIMGRKTWESIPIKFRPLKGRLNVVLSRSVKQKDLGDGNDCPLVFSSFDEAMIALSFYPHNETVEKIYVIGGSQIYAEALQSPLVHQVLYTEVQNQFECDCFFKLPEEFEEVGRGEMIEDKDSSWQLVTYQRKKGSIPWAHRMANRNEEELQYLALIREIISTGVARGDRTGTGTLSLFGRTMRFSLRDNQFPLLTTKRVFWRGLAEELLWFIKGSTNANELAEKKVRIWDGNGSRDFLNKLGFKDRDVGDLGPVYGFQWRHFGAEYKDMYADYTNQGVDQLMNVINTIKTNPNDRRIIMSAWNPKAQPLMALPPCHMFCQFYVANGELSCQMYQRSCDMGLGVPFNIASYALLTRLIAQVCDLKCGEFIHVLGDAHVYSNHVDPLKVQLGREPYPFPKLYINPNVKDIDKFQYSDFKIIGYKCQKKIVMEMAV